VLGILGIVLWGGMTEECDDFYEANHGLLLGVFHIQVIIMCVASVFGTITLAGFCADLFNDLTKKGDYEAAGETKSA